MSNRHRRRADLADFKRETSALRTYLVEPSDAALNELPLLKAAASDWIDGLSKRVRNCIVCSAWITDRRDVGALLMSTPDTIKPTSVGTAGVCISCWRVDLPIDALERACATVLRSVIPDGRFDPHQDCRDEASCASS